MQQNSSYSIGYKDNLTLIDRNSCSGKLFETFILGSIPGELILSRLGVGHKLPLYEIPRFFLNLKFNCGIKLFVVEFLSYQAYFYLF